MSDSDFHPLEMILRRCAEAAPQPWYPSRFAQETGTPRDSLDAHLDRLRLAGLVRLTDWVQGLGQGYTLTPEGSELLQNPRLLKRWINGEVVLRRPAEPAPPMELHGPSGRAEDMIDALRDPSPPRATIALIVLNVAVFLAGAALVAAAHGDVGGYVAGAEPGTLLSIGALSGGTFFVQHQWWRLLTCCFVHIGWVHLAVNMYSLYVIGRLLERMWGTGRFLTLYLVAGIAGSCGMLIDHPNTVGAGASGAIWGILASMVSWLYLYRSVLPPEVRRQWLNNVLVVFALNLFITFAVPRISKGAHFGGGIGGFLVAFPLDYVRFGPRERRWLAILGVMAVPLASLGALAYASRTWNAPAIAALIAREEINDVQDRYLQGIHGAKVEAEDLFRDRAEKLLDESPEQRNPKEVSEVIAQLENIQFVVADEIKRLRDAPRYRSRRAGEFMNTSLELLEQWRKLLEMTEQVLKSKQLSGEEQRARLNQEQEVQKLTLKWEQFLVRRGAELP
jgi:membrane associated rhomboid family serine protease